MALVTICSDFRAQKEEICHYFHLFPFYLPCSNGAGCHDISFFFNISFKPALSLPSFTLNKSRVVSSAYLRLLIFLPPILISSRNLSSPAFLTMCSACRLNKQGDSRQPCRTPFLILNQSGVPYRVLTVASWPAYRFLRRQVRWSWQESNDKPRQGIEKQRHYSADKGQYSQGYGLPTGHVWL